MRADKTPPAQPRIPAGALVFIAIAGPLAAALLAARGWLHMRVTTLGVDLGTTYSVVAFKDPNTKHIVVPAGGILLMQPHRKRSTAFLTSPSLPILTTVQCVLVTRCFSPHFSGTQIHCQAVDWSQTVKSWSTLNAMPHRFGRVQSSENDSTWAKEVGGERATADSLSPGERTKANGCPVDVGKGFSRDLSRQFLGYNDAQGCHSRACRVQHDPAREDGRSIRARRLQGRSMLNEPATALACDLDKQEHALCAGV